jgi:xylan 1,4-beta-xylosidase
VESWYWEVWNEPNIGYWHGTPEEWYKLHDYAVDGIRRALPTARVGGPHTAGEGGSFMDGFLQHVTDGVNFATGGKGTPTDFVAFHAKGAPHFVEGHVQLGIADQLRAIDAGFARIAAVSALKDKPIIIGESDPDGCAACQGPQLGYRTGTMYSSYTAACVGREYMLADRRGVNLEGAVTWAFEFEDQPYFAGQRVLATAGIDLPVLNVFRIFSFMGGDRLKTTSSAEVPLETLLREGVRAQADVAAVASLEGKRLCVVAWHYHDDDVPGAAAAVRLQLTHLPIQNGVVAVARFSVDETHANAFAVWKKMGSPLAPNNEQYRELLAAGQLTPVEDAPKSAKIEKGSATVEFSLSRQAVTLWIFDLAGKER